MEADEMINCYCCTNPFAWRKAFGCSLHKFVALCPSCAWKAAGKITMPDRKKSNAA